MPRSSQRRRPGRGELLLPLTTLDRIDYWLEEMCRTFPGKELESQEIANWHKDLGNHPIAAIDYAFENWRRNGRFFPVYADVLDLISAWQPPLEYKPGCSAECMSRHGKGYHTNDVMWLYKRVQEEIKAGRSVDAGSLLAELDSKRQGGAPAWRRA